jgi:hypothetical protein
MTGMTLEELENVMRLMKQYKISKLNYLGLEIEKPIHEIEQQKLSADELKKQMEETLRGNDILQDPDLYASVRR